MLQEVGGGLTKLCSSSFRRSLPDQSLVRGDEIWRRGWRCGSSLNDICNFFFLRPLSSVSQIFSKLLLSSSRESRSSDLSPTTSALLSCDFERLSREPFVFRFWWALGLEWAEFRMGLPLLPSLWDREARGDSAEASSEEDDFRPFFFPFFLPRMPPRTAARGRKWEWLPPGRPRNSSIASAAASVVSSEYVTTIPEGGGVSLDEEVEPGLSPLSPRRRPLVEVWHGAVSDKRSGFELERSAFLRHSLCAEEEGSPTNHLSPHETHLHPVILCSHVFPHCLPPHGDWTAVSTRSGVPRVSKCGPPLVLLSVVQVPLPRLQGGRWIS